MQIRELRTIDEFRQVVALEREIWGYADEQDVVPVPIFVITVHHGGILLGAYDKDRLVGFAYSIPGIRDGRLLQWSHMLGVAESYRSAGLGRRLKVEQRRLALAMGLDLIEWTYDPLQALNAQFNFVKLAVVVEEYEDNVYGESSSVLHRGTPTDRFIARWWIRDPRVERRLAGDAGSASHEFDAAGVRQVNEIRPRGRWIEPGAANLSLTESRLLVAVPTGFTEMQAQDVGLARAWRDATRAIFTTYLSRDYRVVDFFLDRDAARGSYLLLRRTAAVSRESPGYKKNEAGDPPFPCPDDTTAMGEGVGEEGTPRIPHPAAWACASVARHRNESAAQSGAVGSSGRQALDRAVPRG
jgi:predicted GNAT superfamily acetyltransferase